MDLEEKNNLKRFPTVRDEKRQTLTLQLNYRQKPMDKTRISMFSVGGTAYTRTEIFFNV